MKYIKRFNEDSKDIKDFCDSYLSNLIDNTYLRNVYSISYINDKNKNLPMSIIIRSNGKQALDWEDFKIDFLTFYEMLEREFKIVTNGNYVVTINKKEYTKDQIFSNNFSLITRLGRWNNCVDEVIIVVREKSFFEKKNKSKR